MHTTFRISVFVFGLILIFFGALYVREHTPFQTPQRFKAVPVIETDTRREVLIAVEPEEETAAEEAEEPYGELLATLQKEIPEGYSNAKEMIDIVLNSEFMQYALSEEELEELKALSDMSEEMIEELLKQQNGE